MKKSIPLSILMLAVVAGCSYLGLLTINPADGFKLGQVKDASGFQFGLNERGAIILNEVMTVALRNALTNQGLIDANGRYTVDIDILDYSPGNVLSSLMGVRGAGAAAEPAHLSVEARIIDRNGRQVAKIPVERRISADTLGAYKHIFDEAAQEVTTIIKDPARAKK